MKVILNEAFPNWKAGKGIFDLIDNPPWAGEMESTLLDLQYFGNHSGAKIISPLVNALLTSGVVSEADRQILANVISFKFKHNWARLWLTNDVDYNPIHNYDITEDITRATTGEITDSGEETTTPNTTTTVNHGRSDQSTEYIYGLNSQPSDNNPSNKEVSQEGGTTGTTRTGTEKVESNSTRGETENETVNTKRSGNIGVTTSQKMVNEERELWLWNYFEQIFSDVDTVLAIPVYDPCKVQY